jgi:ATP-dependent RNA helicase SUPV3L1/SUV3
MAERLRARRGGAAIVLGALSPRARNAQVAMYESGEVDYLVATDAIGMGLNLDIERVAFADTQKFDGIEQRPLTVAELSQIAGRAGRHLRNGEFGVLAPEPRLPQPIERAIELHQLHGDRSLVWRNHALDFSSLEALAASLTQRPPLPELTLVRRAEDAETLLHLARQPEVRARANSAEHVELLWEACRIPDYRKLLLEGHANLVGEIFVELHDRGTLSPTFLDSRLRRLERGETDIETLMNRIAFTRTWTYVTFREGWVETPGVWRERTRALEDRLSDALHEALVARFVERRKKGSARAAKPVVVAKAGTPFAALEALRVRMTGGEAEIPAASLRERAIDAPHEALSFDADGKIRFEGTALARVVRGRHVSEPELRLLPTDEGAGLERRACVRCSATPRLPSSRVGLHRPRRP